MSLTKDSKRSAMNLIDAQEDDLGQRSHHHHKREALSQSSLDIRHITLTLCSSMPGAGYKRPAAAKAFGEMHKQLKFHHRGSNRQ